MGFVNLMTGKTPPIPPPIKGVLLTASFNGVQKQAVTGREGKWKIPEVPYGSEVTITYTKDGYKQGAWIGTMSSALDGEKGCLMRFQMSPEANAK